MKSIVPFATILAVLLAVASPRVQAQLTGEVLPAFPPPSPSAGSEPAFLGFVGDGSAGQAAGKPGTAFFDVVDDGPAGAAPDTDRTASGASQAAFEPVFSAEVDDRTPAPFEGLVEDRFEPKYSGGVDDHTPAPFEARLEDRFAPAFSTFVEHQPGPPFESFVEDTVEPGFASFVEDEAPVSQDGAWAAAGEGKHGKGKGGKGKSVPSGWGMHDNWAHFEYVHTYLQARDLPPLLSTSPPGTEGLLPGARVLRGGAVGGDLHAGGRLQLGTWLTKDHRWGLVGEFFSFEGDATGYVTSSDGAGQPLLARPFLDTAPGSEGPAALRVAGSFEGGDLLLQGTASVLTKTDLLTADAYARYQLACGRWGGIHLLAGYQFARVDDYLTVGSAATVLKDDTIQGIPPGTQIDLQDVFDVRNKFHGGQLGVLGEYGSGPLTLAMIAKASLGNMNEVVTIDGRSSVGIPAGGSLVEQQFTGGHLALPSNIGVYKRDQFTWIPEAEIKLTYCVNDRVDVSLGYMFTYFANLALAGDQIQTRDGVPVVNSSQWFGGTLNGPANPALASIQESSLWVQGLTFGLTIKL